MPTTTTAKRIAVGEQIDTTTGVRPVVAVTRRAGLVVISVADPASPTGVTELSFASDAKVERLGLTAATMAARRTR
jgi:hypothetical protein